jgi:hypothetical protein
MKKKKLQELIKFGFYLTFFSSTSDGYLLGVL